MIPQEEVNGAKKKIPDRGVHVKQMWNILYAANGHQPILHAPLT